MVGQVVGKVAQKAAKKGIEKLFQQLLKNKIQKEGIVSLEKGTEIMEKASTMAPKTMKEYFRSFGTEEKISPTQVNIGKSGGKKGLFYEESLPFVESHNYVHKLYGKQLEKAKEKGWDPDATYT